MIRHRVMSENELGAVLDWAAEEGWNPGLDDAPAFHAADPEGFFVALDGDRPVAAISVVNHGPDFAFLGLYLCRPDYRGRGIGFALWQRALAHAGDRTVGLDGVEAQQENYARSGFVLAGNTTRFTGVPAAPAAMPVRAATEADIPALIALEAAASGVRKDRFLAAWFAGTPGRRTLVADGAGGIAGVVTYRACRTGMKIGPLVAGSVDAARGLIGAVAAATGGAEVSVDVPSGAAVLGEACREMGLRPGFRTARMYRGAAPVAGPMVCCPSTLELG